MQHFAMKEHLALIDEEDVQAEPVLEPQERAAAAAATAEQQDPAERAVGQAGVVDGPGADPPVAPGADPPVAPRPPSPTTTQPSSLVSSRSSVQHNQGLEPEGEPEREPEREPEGEPEGEPAVDQLELRRQSWQCKLDGLLRGESADLPALVLAVVDFFMHDVDRVASVAELQHGMAVRCLEVLGYLWNEQTSVKQPMPDPFVQCQMLALGAIIAISPVRGLGLGIATRQLFQMRVPALVHHGVGLACAIWVSATQSFAIAPFAAQYVVASTDSRAVRLVWLLLWIASTVEAMGHLFPLFTTAAAVSWMCYE